MKLDLVLRIALRNLKEHRRKTLIIGIIVALGVTILLVGNSLMDTAALGIQRSFIDNYTSHVIISGIAVDGPVSLFGVQSVGGLEATPTIPEYQKILDEVANYDEVEKSTSQITGFGLLRTDREDIEGIESGTPSLLFGIDPNTYHEMFTNIKIIEGRYLEAGEQGIMISDNRRNDMVENTKEFVLDETGEEIDFNISVGDKIRIIGFGQGRSLPSIKVVPILGIFEQINDTEGVGSEFISFIDTSTIRSMLDLTLGFDGSFEIDAGATSLLDFEFDDTQDFFADESDFVFTVEEEAFTEENIYDVFDDLSSNSTIPEAQVDTGAWHHILLRLNNQNQDTQIIERLVTFFEEEGINAQAGNWEVAAGPFATTADVIRIVFNVAIIIVGIVAVIIMMNTLVISVIERTSEIGTMRALGARKGFIRKLFLYEIAAISLLFGIIGLLVGSGIIGIINLLGFEASNTFLKILFAGPVLQPGISITNIIISLSLVIAVSLTAQLYPIQLALKIQPIKAIATE
jgi:putative ABC transport system permease protein